MKAKERKGKQRKVKKSEAWRVVRRGSGTQGRAESARARPQQEPCPLNLNPTGAETDPPVLPPVIWSARDPLLTTNTLLCTSWRLRVDVVRGVGGVLQPSPEAAGVVRGPTPVKPTCDLRLSYNPCGFLIIPVFS